MRLSEFFYWLLSMSITASLCGLIVLLLRRISCIPKGFIKHMWIVPFLRMVVPIGLPWKYGLMEVTAKLTRTVAVPVTAENTNVRLLAMNHIALAERYVPFTYKTDMIRKIFDVGTIIWLIVAVLIISGVAVMYISVSMQHKNAERSVDNIYYSKKADSPFLLGIIKPKIILPASLKGHDNRYIIAHEKCHMRQLDNLSRMIAITVCAIHWFNPFVWIFLKAYLTDIELSCDNAVIRNYSEKEKSEYALALLTCKENNNSIVSGFTTSKLGKRVHGILSYKRLSGLSAFCLTVFFAFICFILLSNGETPYI